MFGDILNWLSPDTLEALSSAMPNQTRFPVYHDDFSYKQKENSEYEKECSENEDCLDGCRKDSSTSQHYFTMNSSSNNHAHRRDQRKRISTINNSLLSTVVLSGATIAFAVWLSMLLNFQLFDRSNGGTKDIEHSVRVAGAYSMNASSESIRSKAPPNIQSSTSTVNRLVPNRPASNSSSSASSGSSTATPKSANNNNNDPHQLDESMRTECRRTCTLRIVESIPENLTFPEFYSPSMSTYEAWKSLIKSAKHEIVLAAYKSSLRGMHVLDEPSPSARPGEKIYDQLRRAALEGGVHIYAVENDPPKDPGDNADALALARAGVLERRSLHMDRVLEEEHAGVMHSKFFIVDDRHFYLGSANFDWRSLNQKMELGLLINDCPCLARDLRMLFDTYWRLAEDDTGEEKARSDTSYQPTSSPPMALTNRTHPLTISYGDDTTLDVYLASSPLVLNDAYRTWDLEAIVDVIDRARTFLFINVMDYIPMIVYQKPRRFWPVIDDAIRRAVVERGVHVRILTAALHFTPESLSFLESLEIMGHGVKRGGVHVRILTVPIITKFHHLIARDRRTHRKFVVTDDHVVVGTSNWSGDYFTSTTGAAIVIKQRQQERTKSTTTDQQSPHPSDSRSSSSTSSFIDQMREVFLRDYESTYAQDLHEYIKNCFDSIQRRDLCRPEKKSSSEKVRYDSTVVRVP